MLTRTDSAGSDLSGLGVLLTRPAHQSEGITAAIDARGGRVCQLPLLEIEPLREPAALEDLKSKIMHLDRYSKAIFISTNAAELGLDWIDQYWPQLPVELSAFAVGPGTAAALRRYPWPVFCPEQGATSEDLLALPELKDVRGQRIALFRGQGGRELLAETLRRRGATVDYIEVYRRRTPDYTQGAIDDLIRRENVGAVVITSGQILQVLLHLLRDPDLVRPLPVIVPSQRVLEQACEAGFTQVVNAGGADDEAIIASLMQLRSDGRADG